MNLNLSQSHNVPCLSYKNLLSLSKVSSVTSYRTQHNHPTHPHSPEMISFLMFSVFINAAIACNKAENPFEKKIPIFKLDTENYGLRDFYDCSELHKGSFSFKTDLF